MSDVFRILKEHPEIFLFYPIVFFAAGGVAFYKILIISIKNNRERERENQEYNEKREERLNQIIQNYLKEKP